MDLKRKRDDLIKESLAIIKKAEKRGTGFTDSERSTLRENEQNVVALKELMDDPAQAAQVREDQDLLARLKSHNPDAPSLLGAPLGVAPAQVKATARDLSDRLVTTTGGQKALIAGGTATATVIARDIALQPQLPTSILERISTIALDSPTYRYLRQTSRANNADVVAAGGLKPTSGLGLTPVEGALSVVAHVSDGLNKYDLLDTRNLQSFVENELRWGLLTKVEQLVLGGDGEDGNPRGLLMQSGIQVQAFATDILTTIRKAITAAETLGYQPNTIVLTPADWEAIELTKATGTGEFVLDASPVDRAARRLFGIQVVVSTAMAAGTALVADLSEVSLFTDRRGVMAEWAHNSGDDFERNLVRLRVEGRFGVAVGQPSAVVKVDTAAA